MPHNGPQGPKDPALPTLVHILTVRPFSSLLVFCWKPNFHDFSSDFLRSTQKFEQSSSCFVHLLSERPNHEEDFFKFFELLRKSELYRIHKNCKLLGRLVSFISCHVLNIQSSTYNSISAKF